MACSGLKTLRGYGGTVVVRDLVNRIVKVPVALCRIGRVAIFISSENSPYMEGRVLIAGKCTSRRKTHNPILHVFGNIIVRFFMLISSSRDSQDREFWSLRCCGSTNAHPTDSRSIGCAGPSPTTGSKC